MKRKTLLLILFVMSLSTARLLRPSLLAAQDDQADYSACSPLDVVFLIDQSSSMSEGRNDPNDNRKYAVEAALDQMTDISLNHCPGTTHRVAVISFGTDATVDLPLSLIGPFNRNEAERAFDFRDELKRSIRADNLGQTDPAEAFALAADILSSAAPLDDGELTRKRAIVFITDGLPCVDDERGECGPNYPAAAYAIDMQELIEDRISFSTLALQRENCLKALRESLGDPEAALPFEARQQCLTDFPARPEEYLNSTFIWLLLLRDANQPYPSSVYRVWENIAANYAGQVIDLENNRQAIPTTFRTILEQLTGVRAERISCGNFAVNPYLERATFTFNKFEPSVKVSLSYTDVDGIQHTLEDGQHDGSFQVAEHIQGPTERYTILYPYPGFWTLASEDCDGLDAFYDPIEVSPASMRVKPVIPQYDLEPYYNPDFPEYLEFELRDANNNNQIVPQAEHPHFALSVTAEVNGPSGSQNYALEKVPNEELFRATQPLLVNVPGSYTVRYTVTHAIHQGEPNNVSLDYNAVFDEEATMYDQVAGFQIRPVTPYRLTLVNPVDGSELKPVHLRPGPGGPPAVAPLPIRLRLTDRAGNLFSDWQAALPEPDDSFEASLSLQSSETISTTLRADPASPGEFIGELAGVDQVGLHELTVRLIDPYDAERYNEDYFPDNPEETVVFDRLDETWRFAVLSPADGETLRPIHNTLWANGFRWPLSVAPIPVRVSLVDENGQPYANPATVMAYAPQVISTTVLVEGIGAGTYLTPDPERPGEYVGEITTVGKQGEHTLTADLDFSYPNYRPDTVPASSTFSRADSLFSSPTTYGVLLGVLVAVIMLMIIRFFLIRNNPVRGELVFRDGSATLAEFGLYNGKNWRVIKGRELNAHPALNLKWIKVSSKPKNRQARGEEMEFIEFGGDVQPSVHVEYRGDGRGNFDLQPNGPMSYEGSIVQMEYRPPQ